MDARQRNAVGIWLLLGALMVYAMIVVGGVTRLTQSGLSMVEWEPLMGVIPPMSESDWNETFSLYQQFPEYQKTNQGMTLPEFKSIFWWEYAHRVLGRTIGLVFFFPFVFFALKGYLDRKWAGRLTGLFVLGGMQGLMGWYMVMSGLVDNPHVSQYRLVAHLGLAVLIYILMIWYSMDLLRGSGIRDRAAGFMTRYSTIMVWIISVMILSGGFMAGTRAGFTYNTFPTMYGEWIPAGVWALQPAWRNLFENVVNIQFFHRAIALMITFAVIWILVLRISGRMRPDGDRLIARSEDLGVSWLILAAALQVTFGIITLLKVVPVSWAAMHQAGAIFLLTGALYLAHCVKKERSSQV
jgi:cytochrome c oxidase assembly protein subunit 15